MRGTFLRVTIIRTIVFWGLYWGHPILGNYQIIQRVQVPNDQVPSKGYMGDI